MVFILTLAIIASRILIWPYRAAKSQPENIILSSRYERISAPGKSTVKTSADYQNLREKIIEEYKGRNPREWGEFVSGARTHLSTGEKVVALTFDADGGRGGDDYDAKLIEYLKRENVPATLFVTGKWINGHRNTFLDLAKDPLFEIENHGTWHRPCSVTGRSAYHITGTANVGEVVDEIELNAEKIEALTGRKPKFYRPGTSYEDEVCVAIAGKLGYQVVNFSILGDAGATYSANQVTHALLAAGPGAIVIAHMNHPEKQTADGVIGAVPELKKRGFRFVKLSDYELK